MKNVRVLCHCLLAVGILFHAGPGELQAEEFRTTAPAAMCVGTTSADRAAIIVAAHGQIQNNGSSEIDVVCPMIPVERLEDGRSEANRGRAIVTMLDNDSIENAQCFFDAHNWDGTLRTWTSVTTSGSSVSWQQLTSSTLDWAGYSPILTLECELHPGMMIASYVLNTCQDSGDTC